MLVEIGRFGQAARMRGRADGTLLDHLAWGELLLANSFSNRDEGIDSKSHFCCQEAIVRCNKKPDRSPSSFRRGSNPTLSVLYGYTWLSYKHFWGLGVALYT